MNEARVTDSGDLRKYRTEIPNIVYSLGLTPFELALYNTLKRTAGQNGTSHKSTPTLAKESGMSLGMVSKAKIGLAKPWALLGNKPLIVIKKEKNRNGGKPKDMIDIVDIWRENMAFFSKEPQIHQNEEQVHSMNVTSSQSEIKKEPSEEGTIKKEEPRARAQEVPRVEDPEPTMDDLISDMVDYLATKIGPISARAVQTKAVKWLLETYNEMECQQCLNYLLTEKWRTAVVTWKTVQQEIGNWKRLGSPVKFEPKHNGNRSKPDDPAKCDPDRPMWMAGQRKVAK